MPQLKTRQLLVDVARQLFAKNGFDNTTMNDIAESSGKGRRTLYTYFKNKEEVYSAVIDAELMRISSMFLAVARRQMPPLEKLVEMLFAHLSLMKEAVERNGNLRSAFFRNMCFKIISNPFKPFFSGSEILELLQFIFFFPFRCQLKTLYFRTFDRFRPPCLCSINLF